jgi:dihydroorotate dehydrogenase electron transfer subunit
MHGPFGRGFPVPPRGSAPILVAGGSGFPPLLFFSHRFGARARLFLGARNKECLPPPAVIRKFKEDLEKVHIATEDGSRGTRGVVTDLLAAYLSGLDGKAPAAIYACGPRPMLAAVSNLAAERSVLCYVSMEERMACGLGACMGCSVGVKAGGYKRVCKEGPVFDAREIDWGEKIVVPIKDMRRST